MGTDIYIYIYIKTGSTFVLKVETNSPNFNSPKTLDFHCSTMRWLSLNRADIGCFTIESHAVLKERGENQQRAKGVTLQTQQREADKN